MTHDTSLEVKKETSASPTQAGIEIEQGLLTAAIEKHGFDPTWKVVERLRAAKRLAENIEHGRLVSDRRMASLVRGMLEPGVSRTRSLHDAFEVPEQKKTTEEAWAKAATQGSDASHAARLGLEK